MNLISKIYKYTLILIIFFFLSGISFSQEEVKVKTFEIDDINVFFKSKSIFEDSEIKLLLASKEGDIFDMDIFMKDVERVKKYYFDNGYFDVYVDTSLTYNIEDEEVNENFIITANSRYRYYELNYTGLGDLDENVKSKINDLNLIINAS